MAKSKSMTGIIIALSVLLVLSLTATIALAYFSASRTASTTITFDSGIVLTVNNITKDATKDVYYWDTDRGPGVDEVEAGSSPITLKPITVQVTGNDAFVAVKATVTGTPTATPTYGTNWKQFGDWYVYCAAESTTPEALAEDGEAVTAVHELQIGTDGSMDAYAGASYECTVEVQASDTLAGLAELNGEASISA